MGVVVYKRLNEVAPARRIKATADFTVRFVEVDAQGVVWHGNYLRYFELGREAVLALGALTPSDLMKTGLVAPIVECDVRYRAPLTLDDRVRVEAELVWEGVPRFDFEYRVIRVKDGAVAATGTTRQVIIDGEQKLALVLPEPLRAWARRVGLPV
jgi:acyl-CoA thioester hydrolase